MYRIQASKLYERSLKKLNHSGKFNILELNTVIRILASGKKLDSLYQDHGLQGEYEGYRECHIRGDVLLIYKIEDDRLILILANIGSHSELF